ARGGATPLRRAGADVSFEEAEGGEITIRHCFAALAMTTWCVPRPHATNAAPAGELQLPCVFNRLTISALGRARLNRKPCPSWHPSLRRQFTSASVSTPSAVMVTPRPLPRLIIERTIACASGLAARSRTKDWSILILSNGKLRR